MNNASNHIISRLKWDTQVSDKRISFDLQNRISDWSNSTMVRDVNAVFDKYCPENQTWRMQRLELDLGKVGYDNLEEELSLRLIENLSERLSSFLIKSKYEDVGFELFEEEMSDVQIVVFFLKNGYLPWYDSSKGRSINRIVAELFQSDRLIIDLTLKKLIHSYNIRKRLVWQFETNNIKNVIQGIEPTNSEFIFSFSASINKIQKEEAIVKTNSSEFEKGIWLWTLNHLVADRGSLFNQVEFVKSTILQMSNHYNVSYDSLLNLIIKATAKKEVYSSSSTSFISALKIIEKQSKLDMHKADKVNQKVDLKLSGEQLTNADSRIIERKKVEEVVSRIYERIRLGSIYSNDFVRLQSMWESMVKSNPKKVNKILVRLIRENQDLILLPFLLSDHQLKAYLDSTKFRSDSDIKKLIEILSKIEQSSDKFKMAQVAITQLQLSQLKSIWRTKKYSTDERDKEVLLGLFMNTKSHLQYDLSNLIKDNLEDNQRLSSYMKDDLFSHLHLLSSAKDVFIFALKYLKRYTFNKREVIEFLSKKVESNEINILELLNLDKNKNLLEHLLPMRFKKVNKEINTYFHSNKLLFKEQFDMPNEKSVLLMVWHCVLDTSYLSSNTKDSFLKLIINNLDFKYISIANSKKRIEFKSNSVELESKGDDIVKVIREALNDDTQYVFFEGHQVKVDMFLSQLLDTSVARIAAIFKGLDVNDKLVRRLQSEFKIEDFFNKIRLAYTGKKKEQLLSLLYLIFIVEELKENKALVNHRFWHLGLRLLSNEKSNETIKEAVKLAIGEVSILEESASKIMEVLKTNRLTLPNSLSKAFNEILPSLSIKEFSSEKLVVAKEVNRCVEFKLIDELTSSLFLMDHVPSWFRCVSSMTKQEVYTQILTFYPSEVLDKIKRDQISKSSLVKLVNELKAENIAVILQKQNPAKSYLINKIKQLIEVFYKVNMDRNLSIDLNSALGLILLKCWAKQDWQLLSPENIWSALLKEMTINNRVASKKFEVLLKPHEKSLPKFYLSSLKTYEERKRMKIVIKENMDKDKLENIKSDTEMEKISKHGIQIENAGIVLLNNYLLVLFDRLGLTNGGDFIDKESRIKAVQFLHFVSSGSDIAEEQMLSLNKVICGVSINEPIPSHFEITAEEKDLINGLLNAVVNHWGAIGDTSVDGFRGNWIVRNGLLSELDDKWELQVEKKAYDLLLGQSPFSFSIIKYSWMQKSIHVQWAY